MFSQDSCQATVSEEDRNLVSLLETLNTDLKIVVQSLIGYAFDVRPGTDVDRTSGMVSTTTLEQLLTLIAPEGEVDNRILRNACNHFSDKGLFRLKKIRSRVREDISLEEAVKGRLGFSYNADDNKGNNCNGNNCLDRTRNYYSPLKDFKQSYLFAMLALRCILDTSISFFHVIGKIGGETDDKYYGVRKRFYFLSNFMAINGTQDGTQEFIQLYSYEQIADLDVQKCVVLSIASSLIKHGVVQRMYDPGHNPGTYMELAENGRIIVARFHSNLYRTMIVGEDILDSVYWLGAGYFRDNPSRFKEAVKIALGCHNQHGPNSTR